SKNNNALILDIQSLSNISTNDIITALASSIGEDFLAAKIHMSREKRSFLEVVFKNNEKVQLYAAEGISLFKQSLFGYIPVNLNRTFLTVKLRNMPLGDKKFISDQI